MRTLSSGFATENNKLANKPVVEVQFTGITERFSSGTFVSISGNHFKYISDFNVSWPESKMTDGVQTDIFMDFTIIDKSNELTDIIQADSFFEIQITARMGDQDIAIGDFFDLPVTNLSKSLGVGRDLSSWRFSAGSVLRLLNNDIFKDPPTTTILADYNTGDTTSPTTANFSSFIVPTDLPSKIGAQAYFVIDDEIIKYEVITTSEPATITRGMFSTDDSDHLNGALVTQFYAFTNITPMDWLLYVLLTGGGHAYYDLSTFDTAFNDFGLGLTASEVNITEIERIGYKMFDEIEYCHFLGSMEVKGAKTWLIENILKPSDHFIFVDSSNKLTVGVLDIYQAVVFNDESNSISNSEIVGVANYSIDMKDLTNEIHYEIGINPLSGEPNEIVKYESDTSKAAHTATVDPVVVFSPLITTDAKMGWAIARRMLLFFGDPPIRMTLKIDPRRWLFETFDTITVNSDKIPDIRNGGLGISEMFVIVGQELSPLNKRDVSYQFLGPDIYRLSGVDTTFTIVTEGSITKNAMTFNSPATNIKETEDAKHDFGSNTTVGTVYWDIKVTPPNAGTNLEHWISFRFKSHAGDDSFITGTNHDRPKICRYNSSDSVAFTVRILLVLAVGDLSTPNRTTVNFLTVQWFDASATGGSGDRPTSVELVELGYLNITTTFSKP